MDFFLIFFKKGDKLKVLLEYRHPQSNFYDYLSNKKVLMVLQVLRNTMGVGVYRSMQISVTKVYRPTLLALLGRTVVSNLQGKNVM